MKGIIFLALMLSFSFISTTLAQEQAQEQVLEDVVADIAEEVGFPGLTRCNARLAELFADGEKANIIELILDTCGMVCVDCLGSL